MQMNKTVREEFIRFWFGLAATAIGVIIALYVDARTDRMRDRDTYNTMRKALYIEAEENKRILEQSFIPNYANGIVHRDFCTRVCDDFIAQRVFLDHAPDSTVATITNYILCLKRANTLRATDEKYKYDPPLREKWGKDIGVIFSEVINHCGQLIPKVMEQMK
jgi:hypothetical protein